MKDVQHIGLYGLTYKENVDDVRESLTLQMQERMEDGLAGGLVQIYDPYILNDIVPNQHHDFDTFLEAVDMVAIMVGRNKLSRILTSSTARSFSIHIIFVI